MNLDELSDAIEAEIEDLTDEVGDILKGSSHAVVMSVLLTLLADCISGATEDQQEQRQAVSMVVISLTEALEINTPIGNA